MKFIVATDLDGTLLYPKRPLSILSRKNRDFLRRMHERGGEVVLATGRNSNLYPLIQKKLGFSPYMIGCNGGFVRGKDGELIESNPIPRDLALEVYTSTVGRYGLGAWLLMDQTATDWIDTRMIPAAAVIAMALANKLSFRYGEKYVLGTDNFMERLSQGGIYKIQAMPSLGDMRAKIRQAALSLRDRYSDRLNVAETGVMIEISSLKASKGRMLSDLAARLGVPPERVFPVGDSGNDVSMFERFPHSFVMASAPSWVKKKAAHEVGVVADMEEWLLHPERMASDLERSGFAGKEPERGD